MSKVDERIFDRSRYSSEMIRDMDIMSVYFIDIVYNYLYDEAKKLKVNGKVASVTEGYKHALDAFINALCKNPRLYRKALSGIHEKFLEFSGQAMTFPQCMNRITKHFIPQDYHTSLSDGEKMSILNLVIGQSIKKLVMKIIKSHIVKIIDYHSERTNISLLKEELIDLFIFERMGVYTRFLSKKTKTGKSSSMNDAMIDRMQKEIKKLVTEKIELEKKNREYVKLISTRVEQIKTLMREKTSLVSELGKLKIRAASLSEELDLMKNSSRVVTEPVLESSKVDNIQVSPGLMEDYPTSPPPSPSSPKTESLDISELEVPDEQPPLEKESEEQIISVPKKESPKVAIDLGDEITLDAFI